MRSGEVSLAVEEAGDGSAGGPPVVLAHGLTATRRYVVHGSRKLERAGHRVISYDARGHGDSSPAPDRAAYRYSDLVTDLEAVLDEREVGRAVLVGASMGAATTLAFALAHPERVAALVQVTPAHLGLPQTDPEELARWDALAEALEHDGVEGFVRAYGEPPVEPRFRGLIVQAIRQRVERHRHPAAVADALRAVPRSTAFEGVVALEQLSVPTLIVASRDDLDPQHPYEVAQTYAEHIEGAELVSEEPGASPLAWRGAQLSGAIMEYLARAGVAAG
ncbi:MAG TPA: alpha/beta fold hydrolase [Solirubrobacterales bacterium]|nr:alpha/beta fold hydrolase [Solirubrobacterales bacterium]